MMHRIMRLLKEKQNGQALVLALAFFALGSLMIAPMLSLMGTGLNAGVTTEDKLDQLYDADAGIQDALWKINNATEVPGLPLSMDDSPLVYNIPILNSEVDEEIDVDIAYINPDNGGSYLIRSWVGNSPVDYETKIEAIVATVWLDYYDFLNHVITTSGEIDLNPPNQDPKPYQPEDPGHENGPREGYDDAFWPTVEELASWYMRDVNHLDPFEPDEKNAKIDIADLSGPSPSYMVWDPPSYTEEHVLGPIYRNYPGESMLIQSTVNVGKDDPPVWLYLGDPNVPYDPDNPEETVSTIFVVGDLTIGGAKEFTLHMNKQTIFVIGDVVIDQDVTLAGHGCVIASGDVYVQPKMYSGAELPPDFENTFMFIMSINGTVTLQPQGDYYGSVAGNVEVGMQPGADIQWNGPEPGLNFPIEGAGGGGMLWGIHTWEIN